MSKALRYFAAAVAPAILANCDDTCPPGFLHTNHVCIPEFSGTGGTDTGADAATDAGQQNVCTDSTFGNTCMTADQCGCDTGFCAGYPGQQGICTHSNCLADPQVCPSSWNCQDFSAFQAGLSLCTPP